MLATTFVRVAVRLGKEGPRERARSDATLGYSLAFDAMTTRTRKCRGRDVDLTQQRSDFLARRAFASYDELKESVDAVLRSAGALK